MNMDVQDIIDALADRLKAAQVQNAMLTAQIKAYEKAAEPAEAAKVE